MADYPKLESAGLRGAREVGRQQLCEVTEVHGLHHRQAERLARREFPSLAEAQQIAARYTAEQIIEIARRGFADPSAVTDEEAEAVVAYTRVRFSE
jgi:hypothetical protein